MKSSRPAQTDSTAQRPSGAPRAVRVPHAVDAEGERGTSDVPVDRTVGPEPARTEEAQAKGKRRMALFKAVSFLIVFVLLFIADRKLGISSALMAGDSVDLLSALRQDSLLLTVVIWILAASIGSAFLVVPIWVFALVAGMLFGPVWGSVVSCIVNPIGAILAFLAGRYFLQDAVEPLIKKNRLLRKWLLEERTDVDILLIVTRMVPIIPFNILNLAFGITEMKPGRYTLMTFLFLIPVSTGYCFISYGLLDLPAGLFLVFFGVALIVLEGAAGIYLMYCYVKRRPLWPPIWTGAAACAGQSAESPWKPFVRRGQGSGISAGSVSAQGAQERHASTAASAVPASTAASASPSADSAAGGLGRAEAENDGMPPDRGMLAGPPRELMAPIEPSEIIEPDDDESALRVEGERPANEAEYEAEYEDC